MSEDSFNKCINIIDKADCFIFNNNVGFNILGPCDIGSVIKTVKNIGFIKKSDDIYINDNFSRIISDYNLNNELFYNETKDRIIDLTYHKFNKIKKDNLFLLDNFDSMFN